jgi:hypothetical protein
MPNRRALVVAINDYGGPPNNLPSCIADGNAFSRLLQASYSFRDVRTLYDAKATVANVEKELDWLVKDAKPDDQLAFFFSGHGFTQLVNEVMEEFLVLRDDAGKPALWEDDKLVAKTQGAAAATLTVILDCCFSGGLFKLVFDPRATVGEAEVAQVKVYQAPPEEHTKAFESLVAKPEANKPVRVAGYRRFGCAAATSPRAVAKAFALEGTAVAKAAAPAALSDSTEALQPELNGLLISACLETETAAASTSKTEGMSAFTHSMLRALASLGNQRTGAQVLDATAASLKALGFRQTPLVLERATPGNLRHRSFISLEAKKVAELTGEKAFALESSSAATAEEMQKFLPLLGAILPAVISAAPSIISAIRPRPRHKAFELGGASSAEEMQKFLPLLGALLPAVISAAPGIISAVRGRRKEFELGAEPGMSAEVTEEEMQKFLPLLGALLPAVISAVPGIIEQFSGGEKAFGGVATEEGDEKIFGAVLRILPQVLRVAPTLVQAFAGQQKAFELPSARTQQEADEKIFGAVLRILPQVLRVAPTLVQAFAGQQKGFELAPAVTQQEADEKIFGAVLRILPQVLRAAPGIIEAIAGQQKGFELAPAAASEQEADAKIFGAVLRILPQVLRAAPGIIQAIAGPQKGFELAPAPAGTLQEGDEKIFGAILRVLPHVLQAAPGIIQTLTGAQKGLDLTAPPAGALQEGDEKIFGAVLRILPQVLPHVLQAAPGIAQAIAGQRR